MKLFINENVIEGTPEELVKYKELLEDKNQAEEVLKSGHRHVGYQEEEEEATKGYTFWYIEGSTFNNHNVLKTIFGGYFEDSKGRRYSYQSVHGLINPINRKDVREEFEEAKNQGGLLKYYSSLDVFGEE